MLISLHCYLFDFVLFYCFQVLSKHTINFIDFGLKVHFEKTYKILVSLTIIIEDLYDVVKFNQIKGMIKSEFLQ
jgi:hypothetical protein